MHSKKYLKVFISHQTKNFLLQYTNTTFSHFVLHKHPQSQRPEFCTYYITRPARKPAPKHSFKFNRGEQLNFNFWAFETQPGRQKRGFSAARESNQVDELIRESGAQTFPITGEWRIGGARPRGGLRAKGSYLVELKTQHKKKINNAPYLWERLKLAHSGIVSEVARRKFVYFIFQNDWLLF